MDKNVTEYISNKGKNMVELWSVKDKRGRNKDRQKMWIMKGAFHRLVKEKCHEPDIDGK